ncbi:electron transport complex subunit RsxC [bacterium]|nr:electron transport complex subunit RsxC [bacterium]
MQRLVESAAKSFRHGVHPGEHKDATHHLPIERMPFVDELVLPLAQNIGAPSVAVVEPGQRVARGQKIARPGGFVSTALHAPVSGTIRAIELRPTANGRREPAIVIKTDPWAAGELAYDRPPDPASLAHAEFIQWVQDAGFVGLGGAAFPTHVKLSVPEGKKVRFVVANGCECEPYLTCDHRIMAERPGQVVRGLRLVMARLGVTRGYVGVESNKPDAIEALKTAAGVDAGIEVIALDVKYPQGAEKMLIDAIFRREVPSGRLPLDLEMVVQNVGTLAGLADLFDRGIPLIERVVTVTGPGIRRPANVLVPLGTPLGAVIEHCGGLLPGTRQIILGGPMMGMAQKSLDVPIVKGASGIVAFTSVSPRAGMEQPCIRCGRCLDACPMFLNPSRLAVAARNERADMLEAMHIADCFECASCSFVCPSSIPLVQLMRVGKGLVRQKNAK